VFNRAYKIGRIELPCSACAGVYSFTLIRPALSCTELREKELEPTGGAHRCCTRLALAVGESTLVTKRVAKNDCDFRAQRSPERMLILLTEENRQGAFSAAVIPPQPLRAIFAARFWREKILCLNILSRQQRAAKLAVTAALIGCVHLDGKQRTRQEESVSRFLRSGTFNIAQDSYVSPATQADDEEYIRPKK
jgi:hypothetical protein